MEYAKTRDRIFDQRVASLRERGSSLRDSRVHAKKFPDCAAAQKDVESLLDRWHSVDSGYFRDGYNHTNLFSMFGLGNYRLFCQKGGTRLGDVFKDIYEGMTGRQESWDVFTALLDDKQQLQPKKAAQLLRLLKQAEPVFYDHLDNFIVYWKTVTGEELTPAEAGEWTAFFETKYQDFQRFLGMAIDRDEPIDVSY